MVAIIFIIISALAIVFHYIIEYVLNMRQNHAPLYIQTWDGSNEPYHPSVLFFQDGWNGFKYWMVETPYPRNKAPYRDRWECPTIHVSNDGMHWESTSQTISPIDDLTQTEIRNKDYFSDPHLIFKDNAIECFYRYSKRLQDGFQTKILRKISFDGIQWSTRETLIDLESIEADTTVGNMVRSPAIIWDAATKEYRMWYVDNKDPQGSKHLCFSSSKDGFNWEGKQICDLNGYNVNPWHIDVSVIDGLHILTVYDFWGLTLWVGETATKFKYSKTLLTPTQKYGAFYSDGLYRTSLIKDMENFKLYFSAYDHKKTYLGLMQGPDLDHLTIRGEQESMYSLITYIEPYILNWKKRIIALSHLRAKHICNVK